MWEDTFVSQVFETTQKHISYSKDELSCRLTLMADCVCSVPSDDVLSGIGPKKANRVISRRFVLPSVREDG